MYVDIQAIRARVFRYNNRATRESPLTDADRFSSGGNADRREATDRCRVDRKELKKPEASLLSERRSVIGGDSGRLLNLPL